MTRACTKLRNSGDTPIWPLPRTHRGLPLTAVRPWVAVLLLAFAVIPAVPSLAQIQVATPPYLKRVKVDQRLNDQIPLDITFKDETGQTVTLAKYFHTKPVVIVPVYYRCPGLCDMELNNLVRNLRMLKFDAGKDFEIVTFSFDPNEKPAIAAAKKASYIEQYKRPGAAVGWHFLTGDEANINRLTQAIGFHYFYDSAINQYAHPSVVMLATPEGRLSRYFYNIEYSSRDLDLGLVDASHNVIGSIIDEALLYCYHYDPSQGKYGLVVFKLIRVGGELILLFIAAGWWLLAQDHAPAPCRRIGSHPNGAFAGPIRE